MLLKLVFAQSELTILDFGLSQMLICDQCIHPDSDYSVVVHTTQVCCKNSSILSRLCSIPPVRVTCKRLHPSSQYVDVYSQVLSRAVVQKFKTEPEWTGQQHCNYLNKVNFFLCPGKNEILTNVTNK